MGPPIGKDAARAIHQKAEEDRRQRRLQRETVRSEEQRTPGKQELAARRALARQAEATATSSAAAATTASATGKGRAKAKAKAKAPSGKAKAKTPSGKVKTKTPSGKAKAKIPSGKAKATANVRVTVAAGAGAIGEVGASAGDGGAAGASDEVVPAAAGSDGGAAEASDEVVSAVTSTILVRQPVGTRSPPRASPGKRKRRPVVLADDAGNDLPMEILPDDPNLVDGDDAAA
ncbi:hypothetical protein BBJ28_00024538, partial [Nothophytophthora sp. Chile5]